jgi:hypothetical protein
MIIENVDEFLERPGILEAADGGKVGNAISARYKVARNLWGRMRRSELIDEVLQNADLQASGFENGIRIGLRQILKNKKKRNFFTDSELSAMRDVVSGSTSANLMKLMGKFGFGEGQATNMLGGSISTGLGATIGNAVAGPPGAFVGASATAGAGSMARRAARRITERAARDVDTMIRAGDNAQDIAKRYLASTKSPDPNELADILMRSNLALPDPSDLDDITRKAVQIAEQRRAEAAAAAAAGSTERGTTENVIPFAVGQ